MYRPSGILKTRLVIYLFILLSGITIFALPAFASGKFEISQLHHDCGTIDEGTPAVMKVEISNIGDADVTIRNVRTN